MYKNIKSTETHPFTRYGIKLYESGTCKLIRLYHLEVKTKDDD